jgi:hypothetical protein
VIGECWIWSGLLEDALFFFCQLNCGLSLEEWGRIKPGLFLEDILEAGLWLFGGLEAGLIVPGRLDDDT